jgi:hypothetical protein
MIKNFYTNLTNPEGIDNNRYFDRIIRRVNLVHLVVIIVLLLCIIFLTAKIYKLNTLENVYVLSPDQTLVAHRADETLVRSEYEVIAFSKLFLDKAFANNRYSFEENLKEAAEWMDQKSAHILLAEMTDENIEALYKEGNAISTVSLEEIVVNREKNPYIVIVKYKHFLHFISSGKTVYEDEELDGELYFEIEVMKRSFKNPYGMQIRNLKFLPQGQNN